MAPKELSATAHRDQKPLKNENPQTLLPWAMTAQTEEPFPDATTVEVYCVLKRRRPRVLASHTQT